ncbi:MAG: flagellar type III secretion system pore protein FliP [Candidatus Margulisiibacteriota bacterium]
MKRSLIKFLLFVLIAAIALPLIAAPAAPLNLDVTKVVNSVNFSNTINLMLALAMISLIPFFLISMTSFIRVVIVLGMIRTAVGTQQVPPTPVIISLGLFMTMFIMAPVWNEIQLTALTPYNQGKISQAVMWQKAELPIKQFMLNQTREKELAMFVEFSQLGEVSDSKDIPLYVIIPAFAISELKTAFQMGFLIYIPFMVIDMIVANILLSLGMFMLSPVMISLPFKLLLFVLADGWYLITRGLLTSFGTLS